MDEICSFEPAWWLPGKHLQTIWSSIVPHSKVLLKRERVELPDGDFLDLDWTPTQGKVTVLLLHGLSGSVNSPYISSSLQAINAAGWQGVVMNFRGCSGQLNRLPHFYNAGDTTDLQFIIRLLTDRYPTRKFAIIGFSLGGNLMLKWLGESIIPTSVCATIAISVPFDLQDCVLRLNRGFSRFYQLIMLTKLKKLMLSKSTIMPLPFSRKTIQAIKTIYQYDTHIIATLYGYENAEEYYSKSSCHQFLKLITTPTLILHSLNDPLISANIVPKAEALSQHIVLEVTDSGGHVGFVMGQYPWKFNYWFVKRSMHYLEQFFSD